MMLQVGGGGSAWVSVVPLVIMVAIFYLLVFVPQARQRKAHRKMVSSLSKGDQVVTLGGLIGEVVSVRDDVVTVRTGQAVVAVERERIARRTGGPAAAKK
jgi:preprotein translocase subunit YajC